MVVLTALIIVVALKVVTFFFYISYNFISIDSTDSSKRIKMNKSMDIIGYKPNKKTTFWYKKIKEKYVTLVIQSMGFLHKAESTGYFPIYEPTILSSR